MSAYVACADCKVNTVIGRENSILHLYTRQPWFNWLETWCVKCHEEISNFVDEHLVTQFEGKLEVTVDDFAPEELVEHYRILFNIVDVKELELGPSLSKLLDTFHTIMEMMPDDDLLDEMMLEQPRKTLPERWV